MSEKWFAHETYRGHPDTLWEVRYLDADGEPCVVAIHCLEFEAHRIVAAVNGEAALRSENATLRAVLEEMREATALAVRILHAEGLGDEFLSECRRLGIKDRIGVRARAALGEKP